MNHPKRDRCGGPAGALIGLAVLLFFVALAVGCGTPPAQPTATEPPETVFVPVPVLEAAATATAVAVRVTTSTAQVESAPPVDYAALAAAQWAAYPCNQWAGTALAAGWPVEQMPKVLRTMFRESRCTPEVRSTTSDSGLMQINDIVLRDWRFRRDWPAFDPSTLFNPSVNLSVALWLWGIDGWTPWLGGA